jgi:hypothetical protein
MEILNASAVSFISSVVSKGLMIANEKENSNRVNKQNKKMWFHYQPQPSSGHRLRQLHVVFHYDSSLSSQHFPHF